MDQITVSTSTIVIALLFFFVIYLISKIRKIERQMKLMNTKAVEQRLAQAIFSLNSAHQTLAENLTLIDNVKTESEEYYKRVKYILDHSGWTAVRLENLTKAIQEIGQGEDTHITLELEAESPNPNAPGELNQSLSAGAEEDTVEMTENKTNQDQQSKLEENHHLSKWMWLIVGFGLGMVFSSYCLK